MSTRSRRGLSHTAAIGFKELPSNVAWALSKAFQPVADGTANVTSSLGESVGGLASSAAESATVGVSAYRKPRRGIHLGQQLRKRRVRLRSNGARRTCG